MEGQLKNTAQNRHPAADPYTDLGNLLLVDNHTEFTAASIDEESLKQITRDNVQFLYNKIWDLPRKIVEDATCVQLPECQFPLPREKPIPKPKEPTRWEKFAKEKGIIKDRNRSRKVWDENAQDWKPRYGYRRANDDTKDWLIEIPENADPNVDYFQQRVDAKKERVSKNEFQRLRNIARGMKGSGPSNEAASQHQSVQNGPLMNGNRHLKSNGGNFQNQRRQQQFFAKKGTGANAQPLGVGTVDTKSKDELTHLAYRSKQATASIGQFQPNLKGDKIPKGLGKKRKFETNIGDVASEKERQLKILSDLQSKKARLNESRFNAVSEHIRKQSKQNDGGDGDSGDEAEGGSAKKRANKLAGGRRSKGGNFRGGNRQKSDINRQKNFKKLVKSGRKDNIAGRGKKKGGGKHGGPPSKRPMGNRSGGGGGRKATGRSKA